MILILSTPTDPDTEGVIDWLAESKTLFLRLNEEDLISGKIDFFYNPEDEEVSYFMQEDNKIFLREIKVVWFRKFGYLKTYENEFGKSSDLIRYLYKELNTISKLLFRILEDRIWLFKKTNMLTKLEILKVANDLDLKIPKTILTSKKKNLISFFNLNKPLMSKPLGDGSRIDYLGSTYYFYTLKINNIKNITEKFTPTLFQKYIEKQYELRIFYIDGQFYSMVIFSQNNNKTKYDFRNYDSQKPNRFEPYCLPKEIEIKLHALMQKIGLNTGSIDMIKTINNEYIFLEVNPSGQFGMTATPCNYPLYKIVANFLITNNSNYVHRDI
jgi:ATP-GRASP peptide maturase of grasp-with-spasm system